MSIHRWLIQDWGRARSNRCGGTAGEYKGVGVGGEEGIWRY